MRVLGVDPGSVITGWGLLIGSPARPALDECGGIRLGSGRPIEARLGRLQAEVEELVRRLRPESAAVESPFHGRSSKSALQLAQARGVILAVLGRAGVEVAEYAPAMVKQSVTGSGAADKEQVRQMVRCLLGQADVPGPTDVSDALAVALCHLSRASFAAAVARSRR